MDLPGWRRHNGGSGEGNAHVLGFRRSVSHMRYHELRSPWRLVVAYGRGHLRERREGARPWYLASHYDEKELSKS